MTLPTEEKALALVETARASLIEAMAVLREARGEAADEACRHCEGTGQSRLARAGDTEQACPFCKGTGRQRKTFPWIVTHVTWDGQALRPALFNRNTTWVCVRPCAPTFEGKTYLGWLLGDLAQGQMAQLQKDGTLEIRMAAHNPAIFVPALGRVIYGYESWWSVIETPEDLHKITEADINNVWYVQMLKDLGSPTGNAPDPS